MKKIVLTLFATFILFDFMNAQVSAYLFGTSSATYVEITGGIVLGDGSSDDQNFVTPTTPLGESTTTGIGFSIGFNFSYNGIVFDRFAVNNNGWISLGQASLTPSVDISGTPYMAIADEYIHEPVLLRNRVAGFSADLQAQAGSELRIETIGTTPNKVCVIQWKNYRKHDFPGSIGDNYNFQIRLKETSNTVEVVYGAMTNNSMGLEPQVGLGGTTNADFNSRKTLTDWAASTAGILNTDICTFTATVKPASGQTYTWTVPPVCSDPIVAGTASGPTSACSGVSFNLMLTGYTPNVSGLTFQWQSASTMNGPYTPIVDATSITYATSQTDTTYYQCLVACGAGTPVTSTTVTVTMSALTACHCIPLTNCDYNDVITNVTISTINNTTTCGTAGYSLFTTPTPTLNSGVIYPILVTVGTGETEHVAVWIDYNQNGDFETTEFTSLGSGNGVTIASSITIPGTATPGATRMRVRKGFGFELTSADACLASGQGEIEDYTITIGVGTPCSGAPVAGTASGPTGVCSGVSFNLVLTDSSSNVSGLTFQWQSASIMNGPYTPIVGATSITYATSLIATTYYQCLVACGTGTTVTSTTVTVTMNAPTACHCIPLISCEYTGAITNVTISTINNTTTCGTAGYSLFTTPTPTLNSGAIYPISVTVSGSDQAEFAVAWIDYNQNGVFETTEFTSLGSGSGETITSSITIPGTATPGATRMRVRIGHLNALTSADACLPYALGEIEDYAITIGVGTPCLGAPVAGTASVLSDSVCNGEIFNLMLTDYTPNVSGLTFQWQSASTMTGTYTPITGATSITYATSQTATTYYKCNVSCSGGTPVASNTVSVFMNPFMDCYCTSTALYLSDEDIFNVTVGTLNNSSTCLTTGGNGSVLSNYSNYTSVAAPNLSRTAVIPFSVQIGNCGTTDLLNAFKIFIDYNQNGSFADAGESVYTSDTTFGAYTQQGTFTVPATAALGNTLMRVVNTETDNASSIDSCGTYGYGETEDYLVNITSLAGIDENTLSGVSIFPNPTNGLFNITMSNANFRELMVSVSDIQGKVVFSSLDNSVHNGGSYNKQINMEGFAKGIYYIKLATNVGVKMQKIIVQ